MKAADWSEFLPKFEVPGSEGRLYVLGCFARHLTLYSQQVRALNLIRALCDTGRIQKDTRVAVIGGGAAGLTAAAAAAARRAQVTVFEKLDGLMELQLNNRQRWLHPHIYDWPEMRDDTSDAGLPLLNWQADYAAGVAGQILQGWETLVNQPDVKTGVEQLRITMEGSVKLNWGPPAAEFDVVIFAVGFGLEPHKQEIGQWSYWSEDDTDGDFLRPTSRPHWLVSGTGDGALTDIMRLTLHRFRHANILSLVEGIAGIEQLKNKLRELHRITDEKTLQTEFLAIHPPELIDKLAQQLRRNGPLVTMVGMSVYMFGPKASVLNRLIVSQLYQILNPRKEFQYLPGPTESIKRRARAGKFMVKIKGLAAAEYDRVILRYGPQKPAPLKSAFPEIWKACAKAKLPELWENTPHHLDTTRARLYETDDPDYFRLETVGRRAPRPAVFARSLTISKQIRSVGTASLTYKVEGLSVLEGQLEGLRVHLTSACGIFAPPQADRNFGDVDAEWQSDHPRPTIANARTLSGLFRFVEPLAENRVANFGFTVDLLNADALTAWQHAQMYGDDEGSQPPRESLRAMAPFPVDVLKVRVTLPTEIEKSPLVSQYADGEAEGPVDGILKLVPESGGRGWGRRSAGTAKARLTREALQSWELNVAKPQAGARYSLDWELPRPELEGEWLELAAQAAGVRRALMQYRRYERKRDPVVRDAFTELENEVRRRYGSTDGIFEVTAMTYDDSKRHLWFFEGAVNGAPLSKRSWDFSLPFGLGLSGACFKEPGRAFFYRRPQVPVQGPELYLQVPDGTQHEALLALPLIHPDVSKLAPGPWESNESDRARFCLGVVNIGSDRPDSPLLELMTASYSNIVELRDLCRRFSETICDRMKV